MAPPTLPGPDETQDDAQWRTAGDRIQTLLDASSSGGAGARERAEQLVREGTDLYGGALQRGAGVRGDVHLVGVDGDTVHLQFAGSCKSCPSSAVTLELAVEDAVRAAAPEISSIEVVAAEPTPTSSVIPAETLLSRVHANGHRPAAWHPVPDLADLAPGEVGGFAVAGTTMLACRVGDEVVGYHDRCGSCTGSLAGAALHRPMGSPVGSAVLRCPRCHAHFDVVHAGVSIDGNGQAAAHLEPIPLLERDGVLSMAVLTEGVA